MSLKEKVLTILKSSDVFQSFDDKKKSILLKELDRIYKKEEQHIDVLETKDGTITLFDKEHQETLHSVSAGAYKESLLKFVIPALEHISKKSINVLDVGSGIFINASVLIDESKKRGIKLNIISVDKKLWDFIEIKHKEIDKIRENIYKSIPYYEEKDVKLRFLKEDFRKALFSIDFKIDLVFHDPFSPFKNPESWSINLFEKLKESMNERAVLVSYSMGLMFRKALFELNFGIKNTEPVGRNSFGTLAILGDKTDSFIEKKLLLSPYAKPFIDESLNRSKEEIIADYFLRVYKDK